MDAAYLKAAVPEPFIVLGKKLRPFCLGHELLFQRFGNRFSIESGESIGVKIAMSTEEDAAVMLKEYVQDLVIGVHICAQRYSPEMSLDNFSIPIRARIFSNVYGPSYLIRAFILFAQYVATSTIIPDFYAKDEAPAEFKGTPTVQAVKVSLMANLHLSEFDALNAPFSLAFWNHLSWAEANGQVQIIDDAERERIAEAKKAEAAVDEYRRKLQAQMKGAENA